jgi:hypothetical protein
MTHPTLHLTLALGLLAGSAASQRTWIVDQQNGPGTNFTNLAPAIAAAARGDRIQVRKGTYFGANVGKALTIVGEDGVLIQGDTLTVQGLPAGHQVVLSGLSVLWLGAAPLVLANNQGHILLDRCGLDAAGISAVRVSSCTNVQITGSRLTGGSALDVEGFPAVEVVSSTVIVTESTLTGQDSFGYHAVFVGSVGLRVHSGRVFLVRSQVTGGSCPARSTRLGLALPAVDAPTQSTIEIRGDATTVVRAGVDQRFAVPISAIVANQGQLAIDPAVQLVPSSGGPPISGTATVQFLPMPSLAARPVGSVVNSALYSPPGEIVLLVLGLPGTEIPLAPLGSLWIDPALILVLGASVQGGTGVFLQATQVPNDPALRFGAFTQQGVSGTPAAGFLLTNPATYTHF